MDNNFARLIQAWFSLSKQEQQDLSTRLVTVISRAGGKQRLMNTLKLLSEEANVR